MAESGGKRGGGGTCDRDVLFDTAATRTNGADHRAIPLDRDASPEDHDPTAVRRVEAEALLAALRDLREGIGGHVERAGCPGLVDRDTGATEPGAIHSHVRNQAA